MPKISRGKNFPRFLFPGPSEEQVRRGILGNFSLRWRNIKIFPPTLPPASFSFLNLPSKRRRKRKRVDSKTKKIAHAVEVRRQKQKQQPAVVVVVVVEVEVVEVVEAFFIFFFFLASKFFFESNGQRGDSRRGGDHLHMASERASEREMVSHFFFLSLFLSSKFFSPQKKARACEALHSFALRRPLSGDFSTANGTVLVVAAVPGKNPPKMVKEKFLF